MELKEIILGAVGLCAVVMVGTGAGVKELGLDKVLGMGTIDLMAGPPPDPDNLLHWDLSHGKLHPMGIATPDGYALLQEVAADHPGNAKQVPEQIVTLDPGDCTVRPPEPGEAIANIYGASSPNEAGIAALSRAYLERRASKWLEEQNKDLLEPERISRFDRGQMMDIVDVYVTETRAPVYLILQGRGSLIFNLQVAEGVDIAQIAVVAPGTVGVGNVPEATPIDVIGSGCGYAMWRMPKAQWDFVVNTRRGIGDPELLDQHYQNAGIYSDWFAGVFGIGAEQGQAGFGKQAAVLAGPLPGGEARMSYSPMGVLHLTPVDLLVSGSTEARNAVYEAAFAEVVSAAVGTDIGTYQANPPVYRDGFGPTGGDQ